MYLGKKQIMHLKYRYDVSQNEIIDMITPMENVPIGANTKIFIHLKCRQRKKE